MDYDIEKDEYMKDWKETDIGKIPSDWEIKMFEEIIIEKNQGVNTTTEKVSYSESGVAVLRAQNIEAYKINYEDIVYVSDDTFDRIKYSCKPKKNEILYTNIGSNFGNAARIKNDTRFTIAWNVLRIVPNNEIVDTDFMVYLFNFRDNKEKIRALNSSSTMPFVSGKALDKVKFKLPPLPTQQKIAQILSSLDDKIELNYAINKNLEEIAQTLFKQWFVDFEFPNENGEPYKSSGGEMVESELGMIPKGWRVEKANDLFSVKDGTHDSPKKSENGFYLITSKNIKNNEIDFLTANKISEEDYNKINFRSKVEKNDILISMIGTVGLTLLVMEDEVKFAIKNIGLFKTSEMNDFYSYFYYYLNTQVMRDYILSHLAGSTQQYISLTELRNIPVLLPNDFLLKEFISTSKSILSKIKGNQTETQTLTKLRDELLPKLMSGEVRV